MVSMKKIKGYLFDISYAPLIVTALVATFVIFLVYNNTQNLLVERLRERLIAIAATASLQFSAEEIENTQDEETLGTIVSRLRSIRNANRNLQYIYIFRRGSDVNLLQFAADADMLTPLEDLDINQNGKIDDDEAPPTVGDQYDLSALPQENAYEINKAFEEASATRVLGSDKWGTYMSGFAPIFDTDGHSAGIIGFDIEVSDFNTLVRAAFIPFSLLAAVLLMMLGVQTVALIRIWKSRVNLVKELGRQKDAVLHLVAHQFKGPVTTINFITELLLDGTYGELSKEQKENITTIKAASKKMGSQADMVLDAAKITAGKLPLEPKIVDLNALFKEIVEEAQSHAKERKVHLKVSLPTTPLPTVILDKKYTQLAFDNLLSNATKYTALKSEGENVEFTIKLKEGTLFCSVKDKGVGIPKADQQNIFKELYRASNAGKDGNGLGLHVTMGAIQAQGGKIRFESEENVGTTFFVELPLKLATTEVAGKTEEK